MSYSPRPGDGPSRHLDLTGDREVVYCHVCHHEWYNDEQPGLHCPRCQNDICEIITPDSDPRELPPASPDDPGDAFPDPDEDDIGAAVPPPYFSPSMRDSRPQGPGSPVDPSSQQEIFSRFQDTLSMLMGFGGPFGPPTRTSREAMFGSGPPGTMQTRTYRSPTGRATFSITTSTGPGGPGARGMDFDHEHGEHDHNHDDDFDMIFGNTMAAMRPPQVGPPGFENSLPGLFSLIFGPGLMGPNAVHGDAVYSQEALDRIITQLMDANPQSNAAPPATEQAIEKLQKRKLDKEMMGEGNKVECTICIDEMSEGDEVTVLPCKHWFHGECVVLWLKEHNTCPICRSPIEKRGGNNENGDAGGSGSDHQHRAPESAASSPGPSRLGGWFGGAALGGNPWEGGATDSPSGGTGGAYRGRGARTPEEGERRLNAIRNLAGPSSYGQSRPDEPRYRRDSWSPTSPPPGASSARDRSPARPRPDRTNSSSWGSQRSGQSSQNTGGNGGSSANPINWIRGRFGGGGNNNTNDDRNRRRS